MESRKTDVLIYGAGLTGLTLAYYFKKQGKKVIIIEKASSTGGVINTITENGFTFETGPSTGVLSSPELAMLFEDLSDNCTLETAGKGSKKRYILKNSKWEALPSGPVSAVTTPLFTMGDKFRILGEPFRKPGTDPDETLSSLVKRRLGQSFLDYAIDPFISGVYAGDPDRIIPRYALPKLYALEQKYGSFIKGAIKKAKEPKTELQKKASGEVFSAKGGLKSLISALTSRIGNESIILNVSRSQAEPSGRGFSVRLAGEGIPDTILSADYVISTFGGESLKSIFPFIPENLLAPVLNLKYAAVVQVAAGYFHWKGMKLDAFGGLIPTKENKDLLGILFPSAIFEGRAPEGGALLSAFLGGIKKPQMINASDDEIKSIVLKSISETLHENTGPDLLRIFRYPRAIPQYDISTGERLARITELEEKYPGLILAGNIRDGIGMSDRVKQASAIKDLIR